MLLLETIEKPFLFLVNNFNKPLKIRIIVDFFREIVDSVLLANENGQ